MDDVFYKENRMDDLFTNNETAIVSSAREIYTASSFARASLLHLQEIGELKALRLHTSSRSNLQSYLFFIVVNGSGKLTYNKVEYSLTAGSCVFVDCRKAYSHTTDENNLWTLRWCHFYGPTMGNIYRKYCERGGRPVFTPEDLTPFISLLYSLLEVVKSSDYMRDMKINSILSQLMVCVMAESWHPEDKALPRKRQLFLK